MSKQHCCAKSFRAEQSLSYLVKRAHARFLDYLEPAIAKHGVTYVQFGILISLRDGLAISPSGLCAFLRHDGGALTRVLDELEERHWIHRKRRAEDRRAVDLYLTREGRNVVESLVPIAFEQQNVLLDNFAPNEVSELIRLLRKLADEPAAE